MTSAVQVPNEHFAQRLRENKIAWLTTVRANGQPHAVPIWYLWTGNEIFVYSKPNNQKLRNLEHNQHVSLILDETNEGGDALRVDGIAEVLEAQETPSIATLSGYEEKYGAMIRSMGWKPESMAKEYSVPIRIKPTNFWSVR